MLPFLKKDYRYEPSKDYTPVALVTSSWTVFAIYPGLPVKTLPETIAYAKANPGKSRYGSGVVGGALHIAVKRSSSSRPALISSTCPIAAAAEPRPTPWRGRSTWYRSGLPARASPRAASF